MSLILMRRGGAVVEEGGGGGGGLFPLTAASEMVASSEFEHSGGAFVDTDILWADDFSYVPSGGNAFGAYANSEGWTGPEGSGTRLFTGAATDSGNLQYTMGRRLGIYHDSLIPQNSTDWTALGMDGPLVKAINWGRGTDYAWTYGVYSGGVNVNFMFDHRLPSGGNAADGGHKQLVMRYERWWPSDYLFGAEKIWSLNQPGADAGIMWGNLHINLGAGSSSTTGNLAWQGAGSNASYSGLATLQRNRVYEFVIVVDLDNDILTIYCTDLGAPGSITVPGSRTQVLARTDYTWAPLNGTSTGIGVIWPEGWANPVSSTSTAGGSLMTNIVVRKGLTLPPIREAA
jgi:hypothetical protein